MTVTLGEGKKASQYEVSRLPSDFGIAFRFTKPDGTEYDACVDGQVTHCDCMGHSRFGYCKHTQWVKEQRCKVSSSSSATGAM